jgi:hypothetical protein
VWLLAGVLFLASFVPRAVFPLATSVCYDETAAKDSGPMWDLLKRGDFLSEGWAQYPYLPFYKYLFGLLPQALFGADPSNPDDLAGARGVGALLGSGIVVMAFLVGRRCLPLGAAFLGALLLASFPSVLGHDRIAMHDAPSRLLALVGWWFVLRAFAGSSGTQASGAVGPAPRLPSDPGVGHRGGGPPGVGQISNPLLRTSNVDRRSLLWGAFFFGLGLTFFHRTAAASGLAVAIYLFLRLLWTRNPVHPVNPVNNSGSEQKQSLDRIHKIRRISERPWGGIFRTLALFGAVSLGSWLLSAWLLWPYMWFRPWELWRWYADPVAVAGAGGGVEFWFGAIRVVPRHYYLVAILACTPPLTLLAFAGWHALALRDWLRQRAPLEGKGIDPPPHPILLPRNGGEGDPRTEIPLMVEPVARGVSLAPRSGERGRVRGSGDSGVGQPLPILLLFWVPLLVASLTLRQGLTHYLQILMPALCLGAGAGIWRARGWLLARRESSPRALGWGIAALPVLLHVHACACVSPYFLDYFNAFVGGGRGVTERRLFTQGAYGEAILPLLAHVQSRAEPSATVLCRLGPWPGLGQLDRYLGPGLLLQGHQGVDPLGARYVLRAGLERSGEFYRYRPDPALYEKVFDVLADGGSLGDVWRRKDGLAAAGLVYADDFASPQFTRFAVAGQNLNLNPFSDGKLYAVRGDQPAAVLFRFPAALLAGRRSARVEVDARLRAGAIVVRAGHEPRQLAEVGRAMGEEGAVRGKEIPLAAGKDFFVALEWQSSCRWDGKPRTFWDSDWVDALRVYGK